MNKFFFTISLAEDLWYIHRVGVEYKLNILKYMADIFNILWKTSLKVKWKINKLIPHLVK